MKTREAFPSVLLIGQFAKLSGLSSRMLRFYAERNILVPAFTDNATGYRYYLPSQLIEAKLLRRLRQADFSLDDIAVILNGLETAQWGECVAAQRESITRKIAAMKMALEELEHLESTGAGGVCAGPFRPDARSLRPSGRRKTAASRDSAYRSKTPLRRRRRERASFLPLRSARGTGQINNLHSGGGALRGDYAGMRAGRLAPQRNVRDGSGHSGAASCVGETKRIQNKGARARTVLSKRGGRSPPRKGGDRRHPGGKHLFPRPERGIFLNGAVTSSTAGRNRSPMACAVPAADE